MKKKKKIKVLEVNVPEGVEVRIERGKVFVKNENSEISKKINPRVRISKKTNSIEITSSSDRRSIRALVGTTKADIENMIKGITEGVMYKLKVVYSHFPMSLKVQNDKLLIENFIGEKYPRKAKILEGVNVEIKGHDIEVFGIDKEKVAQTAANIENATSIKKRDPRVFQDGIYIYEKDGKLL